MQRISKADLRRRIDLLNDIFGRPRTAYAEERAPDGRLVANAETFTLDCAYGGYRLCQMTPGGGERDLTGRGSARETYDAINAFIKGAEMMRDAIAHNPRP